MSTKCHAVRTVLGAPTQARAHTHTHTHNENCENKNRARKAVNTHRHTHTHTHTRWEPRDKNEARKAVERKLLRNSRAALDVFRSKKNRHTHTHTHTHTNLRANLQIEVNKMLGVKGGFMLLEAEGEIILAVWRRSTAQPPTSGCLCPYHTLHSPTAALRTCT